MGLNDFEWLWVILNGLGWFWVVLKWFWVVLGGGLARDDPKDPKENCLEIYLWIYIYIYIY